MSEGQLFAFGPPKRDWWRPSTRIDHRLTRDFFLG
jgi:hypothetical protein